jgi:hypothetical protein
MTKYPKNGANVIAFPIKGRQPTRQPAAMRNSAAVPEQLNAEVRESVAHIAGSIWELSATGRKRTFDPAALGGIAKFGSARC